MRKPGLPDGGGVGQRYDPPGAAVRSPPAEGFADMSQTESVLKKIQERMAEKDEVIDEQMRQIVQMEDELGRLRDENRDLKHIKQEYDRIKKELDTLLGG